MMLYLHSASFIFVLKAITGEMNSMILPFSVLVRCSGINPMPWKSEIQYLVKVRWRLLQGAGILKQMSARLRFLFLIILVINCISSHKNSTFSEGYEPAAQQRSCSLRQAKFLRRTWLRHDYIQRSQASWLFLFYLVQSPVARDIVTLVWNCKFHYIDQRFIKRTFKYGSCY